MRPGIASAALVAALMALASGSATAASRHADPDWPCPQRLVLKLSPAQFWSGPRVEPAGDWEREAEVAALVRKISPRSVSIEQGETLIRTFASGLGEDRARVLALAFTGLLEETNRQRADLIERIQGFARRQRELADIAARAGEDLRKIPQDATGKDAERRQDLEQRRHYVVKAFEETQRTLRYACEAPVQLETRLGVFARALQEGIS
jgi:hypothetical protein